MKGTDPLIQVSVASSSHDERRRRRRIRQRKRGGLPQLKWRTAVRSSYFLFWVSFLCTLHTIQHSSWRLLLVSAEDNLENNFVTQQQKETEQNVRHNLSPQQEARLDDFLRMLQDHTYLPMLVEESNKAKPVPGLAQRRGPPVMIGRRRSLVEHTLQHHYSLHFLKHLSNSSDQNNSKDNTEDEDENKNEHEHEHARQEDTNRTYDQAHKNLQESLDAYLFQSQHDAYIKANPQRYQLDAATSNAVGLPPFPPSLKDANAQLIRDMFYKAYNAYMKFSFPAAELKPMSCQPGTFDLVKLPALTLIDTLDTLLVLGDSVEFAKSVERLRQLDLEYKARENSPGGIFAVDQNVSVFETNIRVLGGLLSAHQMALAFLNTETTKASEKLPPVSLLNVYDNEEDSYLQQPVEVRRKREHYEKQKERFESSSQTNRAAEQETCPITSPEVNDESRFNNNGDNDVAWGHCGSSHLQECDVSHAKCNKELNKTKATLLKQMEPQWEYDGFLLELALDIGERLLPAFDTRTGIPYGTVNLLYGIPKGETTVASLAGGGTLSLEMELLSRLTGDLRFGQAAKLAIRALWLRRSPLHLVGKHIDVHRGVWTETLSGIGSNSDSFVEYLLKHYLLFPEEEDFWVMLQAAYTGIFRDARLGEWYADVDMKSGLQSYPKGLAKRVLESLMAFYPGMQTLVGEWVPASRSLNSFFMAREYLGFLPERFSYMNWKVDGTITSGAAKHPLRPELLESCYFMHRATKQGSPSLGGSFSGWLWASDFALHHLERLTRSNCGYASVRNLSPSVGNLNIYQNPEQVHLFNEMPSFFLSETIKYLYLTFDDENILHTDKDRDWIFTTEAHPIHSVPTYEQQEESKANTETGNYVRVEELKGRLRDKLKAIKAKRDSPLATTATSHDGVVSPIYLQDETWSDNTQPRTYRNSLVDVTKTIKQDTQQTIDKPRNDDKNALLAFFGGEASVLFSLNLDENVHLFREEGNLAHIGLNSLGQGNGYALKKACANIYAPELTWINAINGGAVDYTDIYVSALSESDGDYPSPNDSIQLMLTSAEALSLGGSGVYLGNMDTEMKLDDQCPIPDAKSRRSNERTVSTNQSYSASQSPEDPTEQRGSISGAQQVELAGLGTFEVSAFPEGSGFLMQHSDSGESIMATFLAEDSGRASDDVYVMAFASMPRLQASGMDGNIDDESELLEEINQQLQKKQRLQSKWKLVGPRLASFFRNTKDGTKPNSGEVHTDEELLGEPERAVVLADLQGNSFRCDVNIVRRSMPLTKESMEGDEQGVGHESSEDVLVATFPCAPALFGPTHMSNLIRTNGVFVEHMIVAPNATDEFGCGPDENVPTVTAVVDKEPRSVEAGEISEETEPEEEIPDPMDEAREDQTPNPIIQLVRRGRCSFYHKTLYQKNNVNAESVIVINNEDNDLFVMSNGGEEEEGVDHGDLPAAVLVTGLDGESILELIKLEEQENSLKSEDQRTYLVAQVSLLKKEAVIDSTGAIVSPNDSDVDWPLVRGSEEALQIFAEGGWGIHAVRRSGGSIKETGRNGDLQLYLLRHSTKDRANN